MKEGGKNAVFVQKHSKIEASYQNDQWVIVTGLLLSNSLSSAKIATLESRVRRVFSESSQLDFNNFKPDDYL